MPEPPQIRAEEVVDRETLRLFVDEAIRVASAGISAEEEIYPFFDSTFRPEGQWRHGDVYLGAIEPDGTSFFNAAFPELEGQDISDLEDIEGTRITEELLAAAAEGGGYVEYLWDNPEVEGDEETGSPKVSYGVFAMLGGRETGARRWHLSSGHRCGRAEPRDPVFLRGAGGGGAGGERLRPESGNDRHP